MDQKGERWQQSSSRKGPGDDENSSSTSSHSAVSSNGQVIHISYLFYVSCSFTLFLSKAGE